MKSTNLAAYLAAALTQGISAHTVRAIARADGGVQFYIHPSDRDGETLDFAVRGNCLQPVLTEVGTNGDAKLEQEIQATQPTAPRLTPADIDAVIVSESFTVLPSGRVTVCELTLRNGFTVRGESAVVCIENFNAEIGERVARENARGKVWELEGYLLRERLHAAG